MNRLSQSLDRLPDWLWIALGYCLLPVWVVLGWME